MQSGPAIEDRVLEILREETSFDGLVDLPYMPIVPEATRKYMEAIGPQMPVYVVFRVERGHAQHQGIPRRIVPIQYGYVMEVYDIYSHIFLDEWSAASQRRVDGAPSFAGVPLREVNTEEMQKGIVVPSEVVLFEADTNGRLFDASYLPWTIPPVVHNYIEGNLQRRETQARTEGRFACRSGSYVTMLF